MLQEKKLKIIIQANTKKERFLLKTKRSPPVLEITINMIILFKIFVFI
jgi:hypothetical protein